MCSSGEANCGWCGCTSIASGCITECWIRSGIEHGIEHGIERGIEHGIERGIKWGEVRVESGWSQGGVRVRLCAIK